MDLLQEMLTYKRPPGTPSERAFIQRFLDPLPGMTQDRFGNRLLRLGAQPTTLFSAHTDTVHLASGRQAVQTDHQARVLFKDDDEPLGADNATGCWLLLQLIAHRVPGLYLFHRQEESGGHGSRWIARQTPALLRGIRHAIAFDRRGTGEVITHQQGARCCSEAFAQALAYQLGLGIVPSTQGAFTDTAHYVGLVPECTNLSVGFENAHSGDEYQDLGFLAALVPALLGVDWEALPVQRRCQPADVPQPVDLARELAGADLAAMIDVVESGQYPPRRELARILGPRLGQAFAEERCRRWTGGQVWSPRS
jgi:hypothetical protein